MDQDLGKAMLPFKMQQLLNIIIEKKKFSIEDAFDYLYSSDLHKQLASESSNLWQYSSLSLYDLLKKEKRVKKQQEKINTAILLFIVFCLENYMDYKHYSADETLFIFKKYNVFDYLKDVYESLHTQGKQYIMEEIDLYISNQK